MENKKIGIAAIAILVIIGLGYAGYRVVKHQNNAPVTTDTTMEPSASAMIESSTGATMASDSAMTAGVKEFTVNGSNFKFSPATITVNKGDKIKITFDNTGGTHNFVIDEFKVKSKTIQGGATDVVEFTADKTGSFEYYCSIGNHRAMGMKGTLVVK